MQELAYRRRTLHPQRRLVIAVFYAAARFRKKENAVSLGEVIKIRRAVFGRFAGGKDYEVGTFFGNLRKYRPARRQKKPAAESFSTILKRFPQLRAFG